MLDVGGIHASLGLGPGVECGCAGRANPDIVRTGRSSNGGGPQGRRKPEGVRESHALLQRPGRRSRPQGPKPQKSYAPGGFDSPRLQGHSSGHRRYDALGAGLHVWLRRALRSGGFDSRSSVTLDGGSRGRRRCVGHRSLVTCSSSRRHVRPRRPALTVAPRRSYGRWEGNGGVTGGDGGAEFVAAAFPRQLRVASAGPDFAHAISRED
jgi:hypothetical protein